MTISNQVFIQNGKFEILDKLSEKKDGKYTYWLKIKCVICSEEQTIRATHKERCICKNCKSRKTN